MGIHSKLSKLVLAATGACALSCGGTVATLTYVGVDPPQPRIGDTATVTFKLTDYRGVALAGTNVTFRLDSEKPGGVTLSPLSATSLKGSGEASTQIVVKDRPTNVVVIATAGDKEVRSNPIAFAGSTFANGRQFTFQCGEIGGAASGGVHAIGAYDNSRHLIAGDKVDCIAHVADRNGDGLPGVTVGYMTEAGTIGPTESSVADVIGNAKILFKTSLPLPVETGPETFTWNPANDEIHTGEYLVPLWMEPYIWTTNPIGQLKGNPMFNPNNLQEPRRNDPFRKRPDGSFYNNNPRDNLVTMIAFTSGEEGFTDSDGDGKFTKDTDTVWDDLTEPFVDSNDNGTWDVDEKFLDVNADTKWNGKNNAWDANTTIWVQERLLWTGMPDGFDYLPPFPTVQNVQATNGQPIQVGCFGTVGVFYVIGDPWYNSIARNGTGDGCKGRNSSDAVKIVGGETGIAFTYPATRLYGFGVADALNRTPQPMTTPPQPKCFPPPLNTCSRNPSLTDCTPFEVGVDCSFTSSPQDGYTLVIGDDIGGYVFNNFP
jgi:hypothetical protein